MARTVTIAKLKTRSARANLPEESEPYWASPVPGQALGYFKPRKERAGTWRARLYLPETRTFKKIALGVADDFTDADGDGILTYSQAWEKAGKWFEDHAEAIRLEAGGEVLPSGLFTVNAALDFYFADAERRGMKGLGRDRQRAAAWIAPDLGALEVAALTRARLEAWLAKMAEAPRRVRTKNPDAPVPKPRDFKVPREPKPVLLPPLPPSTDDEKRARKDSANRVLSILKAALNHALDRRRVRNGEAWQTVKPFRGTTSARIRFLNPTDQVRLVNACAADFRDLVRGALLTGARYGELAKLRVEDFDTEARTVFIAESKSGKPRHVVLTDEGKALFEELTAGKKAEEGIFSQGGKRRWKRDAVGQSWGAGDAARCMAEACKSAKLDPLTFHELRHSYASMLVNAGCPLAYVAAQLGHSDTRMVEKHYGHLAPSALADAIRAALPNLGLMENSKAKALKIAGT